MARKGWLRITGGLIADVEQGEILAGNDVWVRDGRISALLPAGAAPPSLDEIETLCADNTLIIPGLVNAHSHSYAALLRGTVPGAPLDLFVMDAMARRAKRSTRQVQVAVLIHAAEMLKHGITGVVDHFRHGAMPTIEAISAAGDAYTQCGMRAAIAPMFEDKLYLDSMPIDREQLPATVKERWRSMTLPQAADYFAMMEEAVAQWNTGGRLQILLGVDGPQRCTPALLEMAGDFAARHQVGLHTHLLEAKTQALMAPKDCNGSFVAYLDRFGLVGPKSSLAHFVWGNDLDIELAAERGISVVHNPVSNLLLGSGLQPTARLVDAGVNVALGCDSSSCTTASILEQAKFAMLLSRISQPDCDRWLTAPKAVRLATANAASVLGAPGELGVIRPGAHADLVLLDLDHPTFRPRGDLWNHLVLYDASAAVDTVLVGGDVVVKQGRCTWIDENELLAEAESFASHEAIANRDFIAAAAAERPAFQPLILEALQRPAAVQRFAELS
jgi:cytosine/adenosine deaminase-related metal-dependent hydrolase